uniref:Protein takeout-like n=1 Tax=Timema genevievae TaxID=629358 RepID=A0A7R9K2K9_TIMGE|nr:unnamed protein product [Timema genevievae]
MDLKCLIYFSLTVMICVTGSNAIQLPSYITPCKNDENINACAKESAKKAIPYFINGDRKYHIPNLVPLIISELKINQEGNQAIGFNFVAKNATVLGINTVEVDEVMIDLKSGHVEYHLLFPRIEIECDYDVKGKILLLPISGHGSGNITITNVKVKYVYTLKINQRDDGKNYTTPVNPTLDFELINGGRVYITLSNLFNGDKLLGDNMNQVLNENWEALVKDVGPALAEAIGEAFRQILAGIFDLVSIEEAFIF